VISKRIHCLRAWVKHRNTINHHPTKVVVDVVDVGVEANLREGTEKRILRRKRTINIF
jgi:hypothetical protein